MKNRSFKGPITRNTLIIQKSHSFIISIIPGILDVIDERIRLLGERETFANFDKILITTIDLVSEGSKMAPNEAKIAVMETKPDAHSSFVALHLKISNSNPSMSHPLSITCHHVHKPNANIRGIHIRDETLMFLFGDHNNQDGHELLCGNLSSCIANKTLASTRLFHENLTL